MHLYLKVLKVRQKIDGLPFTHPRVYREEHKLFNPVVCRKTLDTSTAQGCLLPQAETPTADPELAEFIHRRLLKTAPVSLFTLHNTNGQPLQAKHALVDQTQPICIHRAMDPVPLLLN